MLRSVRFVAALLLGSFSAVACSASNEPSSEAPNDAGADFDAGSDEEPGDDGGDSPAPVDGGYTYEDGVIREDRFATRVVSFDPGPCAGFGQQRFPDIVLGPPVGGGDGMGSLDVLSLGTGGEIVLSFEPNAIVDGPGVDFIVFENAFLAAGDPQNPAAELAEVSVSEDGVTWTTFPCTATAYPYGACAGWRTVKSSPRNGISPVNPALAGGDPFDLADVGLRWRVREDRRQDQRSLQRLASNEQARLRSRRCLHRPRRDAIALGGPTRHRPGALRRRARRSPATTTPASANDDAPEAAPVGAATADDASEQLLCDLGTAVRPRIWQSSGEPGTSWAGRHS